MLAHSFSPALRRSGRRLRPILVLVTALALAATAAGCDLYTASAESADGTVTPQLTPAPSGTAEVSPQPGCEGVTTTGVVTAETLRRIDGVCVPAATAVVLRCDPSLDPVAVLDAGGESRTFLGGSFAVPVAEIPAVARAVGFGPSGRFYGMADDPSLLYLESGAGAQRWLAVSAPRDVADPVGALIVGDSILDGASPTLSEVLPAWELTVDAVVGRSSSGGISVVESSFATPDVVVIELGTNDHDPGAFRANADRILAAPVVSVADLVVWVTARNPDDANPAINRQIVEVMAALPRGVVADWDRFVPAEALNGDGVHPAAGQEHVFADFVGGMLETWRAAVHHRGPARCAAAVIDQVG